MIALLIVLAMPVAAQEYRQVTAPREWSFPRDHGRHDGYKTEWWYFTGNLREKNTGRRFGFQLTFFRAAMTPSPTTRPSSWAMQNLYFTHAAVSDIEPAQFHFKDHLHRGRPGLAESSDQTMDVYLLDSLAKIDGHGVIQLVDHEEDFSIDLRCAPGRGPIMQGPGGVNAKGPAVGQASYYYSMTRLPTEGSLTVGAKTFQVSGQTWMDHEFSSNALSSNQAGWDWMGLSLSDGTDLMIYRLRDQRGGTDYLSGTRIDSKGNAHYLSSSEIQFSGSNPWKSARSGGIYDQEWSLAVRGMQPLIVRSLMPGQELMTSASTEVNYFEGAAEVLGGGKAIGEGYLEITGTSKALNN